MKHQFVFLCDIDGTLMRRDAPLTEPVIDAAKAFIKAGGLLALCTGRSVVAAQETAMLLGVNLPCILYGGASLYDFESKRHLFLHSFRCDILASVRRVLEEHPDISMQVFTENEIYVLRRNARLNARGVQEENIGGERKLEDVQGNIIKLVMCCDDVGELTACEPLFPKDTCEFAFASRNFVDVVASGCSKLDAMRALSRHLGLPFSSFIAAGDAMTDLPLLKRAGFSFAPANAAEAVRVAVTKVVPDVKEGGIAEAFRLATRMQSTHPRMLPEFSFFPQT